MVAADAPAPTDAPATIGRAIRVAVVDDHALFREGVRLILGLESDLVFVGEAGTVEEGLRLVETTRPDLILLDLRLAQARGTDLLTHLATAPAAPKVLVVTAFPEERDIAEALRLGARGVVVKDATGQVMVSAIRAVWAGLPWLPSELGTRVIATLGAMASSDLTERVRVLTPRERDIVALIGLGLKNREIGARLSIAEKTIKGHLTSIFYKLGVQDRLALALLAVKIRLTQSGPR